MGGSSGGGSAPRSSGGGGGGGGGGGAPRRVAPVVTPPQKPKQPKKPVQKKPVQYVESGSGEATQAKPSVMGAADSSGSSYMGATGSGARIGADKSMTSFVPGAESEGGGAEVLEAVIGSDPSRVFRGQDVFGQDRRAFLQGEYDQTAEVPGLDASVEMQQGVPDIAGGDPGVGKQTFGNRVLSGGEGEVMMNEATGSNAVNTAVPAEQAPSDLQKDPNYMPPSPGKANIIDAQYQVPFLGGFGFRPGGQAQARGAISRGLLRPRGGFGRRFFGSGF